MLRQVLSYRDTSFVKILAGVRRCGKSTLLAMLEQTLLDDGVPQHNIFSRKLDDIWLPIDYDAETLLDEARKAITASDDSRPFYVLLDEVQEIPRWELVVRKLQARPNTDIYITGSNSTLLSGELATHLTGRYVQIHVYPLSFKEFRETGWGTTDDDLFQRYMRYGGMPVFVNDDIQDQPRIISALNDVYESIVNKDVIQRYGFRDAATVRKIARYLFSTSGNLFSSWNVYNALKSSGVSTTFTTMENQIEALKNAFAIYDAEQTAVRGKALLRPQRKFYPVDNGLRNLVNHFADSDHGAQLEGIVFMELKRRGYDVSIGKTSDGEIDFVAQRADERIYIQVTLSMLEESTRARELRPLLGLSDAYPRMVLTLDRFSAGTTEQGIRIVNAVDWLLEA
ncbi:ATP-binding protein [Bifidobacterium eulemuris]|uniref:ATP-binding protein n=1 Tax=Bifidobacterium eulemuris TaxID=1765219 RepID=UPI001D00CC6E|nr:ATP-binding protein [Bifidobacterium eulemuris]